jgi:hypothetical protein
MMEVVLPKNKKQQKKTPCLQSSGGLKKLQEMGF